MKYFIQKINGYSKKITLSLTLLSVWMIWFYTGPIAAITARKTFQFGYNLLYGTPHWYNPSYSLIYVPLREHVSFYAYEYGGLLLASFCTPFIYKGFNTANSLCKKKLPELKQVFPEAENKLEGIEEEGIVPAPQIQSELKLNPTHTLQFKAGVKYHQKNEKARVCSKLRSKLRL